jgi:hypothetical protein
MPTVEYKKARSTINKFLYDLMDEDSDDGIPSAMGAPLITATQQPSHIQPPAPQFSTVLGSFGTSSPSPSEQYQPPPHMWKNVPPASSVYMEQFQQQPFQHPHQQMPPHRLHQRMIAKEPAQQTQQQQQQQMRTTHPSVCLPPWFLLPRY